MMSMFVMSGSIIGQSMPQSELFAVDVAESMQKDEYIELAHNAGNIKVRLFKAELPLNKGLVIFVPDANSGFGRATSITKLASVLPAWGWTTLILPSIELNHDELIDIEAAMQTNSQVSEAPIRDQSSEETPVTQAQTVDTSAPTTNPETQTRLAQLNQKVDLEAFPAEAFTSFEEQLIEQLASVDKQMLNVLGHRLVISQGLSAAMLLKYYSERPTSSPDALVINNPYWPKHEVNQSIPNFLAQTSMPVLDILSQADNRWSKASQKQRRVAAKINLKSMYRQSASYGVGQHEDELDVLAKDIYGWTSFLGW